MSNHIILKSVRHKNRTANIAGVTINFDHNGEWNATLAGQENLVSAAMRHIPLTRVVKAKVVKKEKPAVAEPVQQEPAQEEVKVVEETKEPAQEVEPVQDETAPSDANDAESADEKDGVVESSEESLI